MLLPATLFASATGPDIATSTPVVIAPPKEVGILANTLARAPALTLLPQLELVLLEPVFVIVVSLLELVLEVAVELEDDPPEPDPEDDPELAPT